MQFRVCVGAETIPSCVEWVHSSRASLTVIFPEVRNRKETESGLVPRSGCLRVGAQVVVVGACAQEKQVLSRDE